METVLITGGAGAIGSNLGNRLHEQGFKVVVIDDLSSGNKSLLNEAITFVEGSICNSEDLEKAFSFQPVYVFHLAALFANQNSVYHPHKDLEANGKGTLSVLDKCIDKGVKKLLFTSSSCVYGSSQDMREEIAVGDFSTPYAVTKFLGEKYCCFYSKYHELDTVMVRLFNSYGPGEYPGEYRNVVPNFFRLAMAGDPLPIFWTGEEMRDFNFVDDVIEGVLNAMFADTEPGDVFNLASGKGTKIIELARIINDLTGNKAEVQFFPKRKWDHVSVRVGVIDKAVNKFGYQPTVSVQEGLARTFDWFKNITFNDES